MTEKDMIPGTIGKGRRMDWLEKGMITGIMGKGTNSG